MAIPAVDHLNQCYDSLLALLASLDEKQWQTPSLCPGWTIHTVVAHLTGVETALVGWSPDGDTPAPFHLIGPFMKDVASMSGAGLHDRFRRVTDERRAELAVLDDGYFAQTSWTPVGVQTYGRFMEVRVFDCWVHEQDMRVPLGIAGHEGGPAAAMSVEEVRRSFGYIVGKKAQIPDGRSVRIKLTGPVEGELAAVVEGRARAVETLDHADATIETDSLTFMLLACGRIDPQIPISDGRVRLVGEKALADQLARNLAFTM